MDDETKAERKACDNPWYRLATLHGEPTNVHDAATEAKNRETWNRWMASWIPQDLRVTLLKTGWKEEELTPFPESKRQAIEAQVGSPLELKVSQIDLSDISFEVHFQAERFIFPQVCFHNATFSRGATFRRAYFVARPNIPGLTSVSAKFDNVTFSHRAHFENATFLGYARFRRATFSENAYFNGVTFSGRADFGCATFSGVTQFRSAAFSGGTSFDNATFSGRVDFVTLIATDFDSATFGGYASFTNAEMKGKTGFDHVTFAAPPQCFNAKLHEGTTWYGVRWPETPRDVVRARRFIDAYERLKLEMDRLKKHGDELNFFALEQQCRRVADGPWKGLPIATYGFLSDYGRSYGRPLLLLTATVLVGAVFVAIHCVGFWTPLLSDLNHTRHSVGISFANTVGLLGRPLVKPEVLLGLPDWLKAVATVQSILGIVLLFLFGLGIRNRFRMKG